VIKLNERIELIVNVHSALKILLVVVIIVTTVSLGARVSRPASYVIQ
jgi:hypothetical protein